MSTVVATVESDTWHPLQTFGRHEYGLKFSPKFGLRFKFAASRHLVFLYTEGRVSSSSYTPWRLSVQFEVVHLLDYQCVDAYFSSDAIQAMNQPPFAEKDELYRKLYVDPDLGLVRRQLNATKSPSAESKSEKSHLPGQPQISLQDSGIGKYLVLELATRDLDRLAPHLWLVAKQDSSHISSLTHQIVRGREIIVTEEPGLHLVWIYDRIFIKPVPKYLLSHTFWDFYLIGNDSPIPQPLKQDITRAAIGFLRSYLYLIRHKSDFALATDDKLRLLPKGIRYSEFINFITAFEKIEDISVSPRYNFGELRLTRLNFWSKIYLQRFSYQKVHGQYGAYFSQFYGPILFLFGVFSVCLSAMQVVLTVQPLIQLGQSWIAFAEVSRWFSIFTLVCVVFVVSLLLFILVVLFLREVVFALKDLHRLRTSKSQDVEERASATQ